MNREQKIEAFNDACQLIKTWGSSPYRDWQFTLRLADWLLTDAVLGEQEATLAPIERRGTEGLCKWRLWSLGREYECDLPANHDGSDHQFRGVPWPDEPVGEQEATPPEYRVGPRGMHPVEHPEPIVAAAVPQGEAEPLEHDSMGYIAGHPVRRGEHR